jgi:hypothetical protein
MRFRAYCIIVIGDTIGVIDEIMKITETQPSVVDGKGLYIATFISASSPSELTEFFKLDNRNFLLFELNEETSGFHITKEETHQGLFGFLNTLKQENIDEMTNKLMKEIRLTSDTRDFKGFIKRKKNKAVSVSKLKLTEHDISNMSKTQKEKLLNELIDSGLKNLTDSDKKILELLTK